MLNPNFKEMLSSLNEERVEYLVVGAYALAAHGFPRATGDIDIWLRNSSRNVQKIMTALKKFGAPTSNVSEEDFKSSDMVVQIGVEPCRIDFLTRISGVDFPEAWKNRIRIPVDDLEVYILSKADLLKNNAESMNGFQ